MINRKVVRRSALRVKKRTKNADLNILLNLRHGKKFKNLKKQLDKDTSKLYKIWF